MTSSPTYPEAAKTTRRPDFLALFCARYQCAPAEYERLVFRRCLYWRARLLFPVLRILLPGYFAKDFLLIRYLAIAPSSRNALNELTAYMENCREKGGFLRNVLRLRISARKTGRLITRTFSILEENNAGVQPRKAASTVQIISPDTTQLIAERNFGTPAV